MQNFNKIMNIISAQYNKNNESITVKFEDHYACVPCNVTTRYSQIIKDWVAAGNVIMPYSAPTVTWDLIRSQRDGLLKETDWVGLTDVNTTNKQAWLDYRQQLRDIPQIFINPENVIWPTKP